jgi:hypothetical protein
MAMASGVRPDILGLLIKRFVELYGGGAHGRR